MTVTELNAALRAAYVHLLEQRFGLRVGPRQAPQVDAAVLHVLSVSPYTEPAALFEAFAAGVLPELLEAVATSMTVAETHFFRVTPQIEALRRTVLPDLLARHAKDRRLRLWSAGCSTGEEPYTLAMLVCEQVSRPEAWDIQLVATDLNRAALEVARLGVYGEWSFRDSPAEARVRYFAPTANRWQLNERVRKMVRFAHLNLAEDPFPFAGGGERIDLILCRNVTIYFGKHATQHLYHRFAEAMEPSGWLVLGPSDPVPEPAAALEVVALDGALLWRRRKVAQHTPRAQDKPAVPARRPASVEHRAPSGKRPASVKRPAVATAAGLSMDPLVHLHAGMARLGEGASGAAIDSLRRAAFLDETSALVQFSLGRAYRQIGDRSRSRSAFSRARRLLAGLADDQPLTDGEVATGELRHAVEAQLADLDRARP
jgi:chemotaxis protein methyltransferase CheR